MSFRTFSPSRPVTAPRVHDGWRTWLIGAGLGALAQLFFVGGYITWFLGALCHEMGHTAVALFCGSFAYPAIRLDGHAAAFHQEPSTVAALCIWAALAWLAWRFRSDRGWLILFLVATALYPLVAFTELREYVHLAAGHLGELVFATIFFWRAMKGGLTANPVERPLYSALAWL